MNVHAPEFIPSLELRNDLSVMPVMPVMQTSYPMAMPMAMPLPYRPNGMPVSPHDEFMQIYQEGFVTPNPNPHQYIMDVESLEHQQRLTKYNLEIMEGCEDAVPPPQPRWHPSKPFTFVNSALVERLEDLKRCQREIDERMSTLQLEKTHEKVIASKSNNYCFLRLLILSDIYLQFLSISCPPLTGIRLLQIIIVPSQI